MRVLVTGASGFVGREVVARLSADPALVVRAAWRSPAPEQPAGIETCRIGELGASTDWTEALHGCDVIVHTAARVHMLRDEAADPLAAYRAVNVEGTLALARQAVAAGVRRLVFVSSIKVNGDATPVDRPFTADDPPAPSEPYGISKLEAEQGLAALATETGLEVVVIRPVLVYGPGVKANFRAMMGWLHRRVPLPLAAVENRRSLVAVENLADLVATCVTHPAAANEVFLVSDDDDLSTAELLRRTARALGVRAYLIPVPPVLLSYGARLMGRGAVADRLVGSLRVDIAKTRERLGWRPPARTEAALARAARAFLSDASS